MENKDQLKQYWTPSDEADNAIPVNTRYVNDKGGECIKFVIPIDDKFTEQAEKDLASLIYDYKEDIECIDDKGEVYISGKRHLPYTKQIFFVTELPLENTNFFQKIRNMFTWKK